MCRMYTRNLAKLIEPDFCFTHENGHVDYFPVGECRASPHRTVFSGVAHAFMARGTEILTDPAQLLPANFFRFDDSTRENKNCALAGGSFISQVRVRIVRIRCAVTSACVLSRTVSNTVCAGIESTCLVVVYIRNIWATAGIDTNA